MDSVLAHCRGSEGVRGTGNGAERVPEGEAATPSLTPVPHKSPLVEIDYVIQDGGSTDDSPNLIGARSSQLAAWESAPDGGQAQAVARGFAKTSGRPSDLMAWINSDDFYMSGALIFVSEYFARHP